MGLISGIIDAFDYMKKYKDNGYEHTSDKKKKSED